MTRDVEKGEFISIAKMMSEFFSADEILNRKVSKMGNSGHISVPAKHLGKQARVFILKKEKEEKIQEDELVGWEHKQKNTGGGAIVEKPSKIAIKKSALPGIPGVSELVDQIQKIKRDIKKLKKGNKK